MYFRHVRLHYTDTVRGKLVTKLGNLCAIAASLPVCPWVNFMNYYCYGHVECCNVLLNLHRVTVCWPPRRHRLACIINASQQPRREMIWWFCTKGNRPQQQRATIIISFDLPTSEYVNDRPTGWLGCWVSLVGLYRWMACARERKTQAFNIHVIPER